MKLPTLSLSIALCLTTLSACRQQPSANQETDLIKEFYTKYIHQQIDKSQYMDSTLIKRLDLFTAMIYADPVLDAQDLNPEILKTLKVEKDRGNWYKVNYNTIGAKTARKTQIQIKLQDGKITEVYPWRVEPDIIDAVKTKSNTEVLQSSATDFITSFYKAYTDAYIAHNSPTAKEIKTLKDQHTTQKFKQKIEEIKERLSYTPEENYDLLIDNITFDKSFRQCLKVTETEDTSKFIISYIGAFYRDVRLTVHVIKQSDTYLIDDIEI